MAVTKPANRRASVQLIVRMTPDEAALVRRAIPRGDVTPTAVQLLVDEARARLASQLLLDDETDEGRAPAA